MASITLNNGRSMPVIGLGTWLSDKKSVTEAVKVAIETGYRHIDCAWVYQNETEVGEGIKAKIEDGTVNREDLFITTKLWNSFHRPDLVETALRDSLKKLGLTYVDLYLMHWPFAIKADDEGGPRDADGNLLFSDVDYIETWREMEKLVDRGLTRSIGVSNFNPNQLDRLLNMDGLKHKPVTNQIEVNPYCKNEELIEFCKQREITVTAFAPLGSPGSPVVKTLPDSQHLSNDAVIKDIGVKSGKTTAQVLLRWGIQRGYAVIPKSVTPSRIKENFEIMDFELSEEVMKAISDVKIHFRACAFEVMKTHKYYPFDTET